MGGVPSARGVEWKGREMKESREKWNANMDRIFGVKKQWYEKKEEENGDIESEKSRNTDQVA